MMHPKPTKYVSKQYRAYQQGLPCEAFYLGGCSGDVVGAHLDAAGGKGIGTKTDDFFVGSLCHAHHQEESRGWARFYHRLAAEDTFFLLSCIKAYRFMKFLKWLVDSGQSGEIEQFVRGYK